MGRRSGSSSGIFKSFKSDLRVIVLGYIVRGPLGGLAWHHLQYVLGLKELGHDVYFIEDSDDYPSCYDPTRHVTDTDPSYGLTFASNTFNKVGLGDRWVFHDAHTSQWLGPCAEKILDICRDTDIVLNLSGVNPMRPWFLDIPVRVFVDTDPVFIQIRHLTDPGTRELGAQHTCFLTFGENLGLPRCSIPLDGFPWNTTRQPIVLDAWKVSRGPAEGDFTTVMQWDSYDPIEYMGKRYEMKSKSFEPFVDIPHQTNQNIELALGSPNAPRERLLENGWRLRDPLEVTRDPWTYQQYIRNSKAEFGVAKDGYVKTRSGWFSERSAAYLASGRPVLVQETGYSDWMQTGSGVIPFSSPEEAIAGIEEIDRRYEFHCKAAREIAEEYFDARKVLNRLIEYAMDAPTGSSLS